ncbi:MAG TPA: helix-turn-helix domain-containing protein [Gemmatimonadales bacterium]|nr:helix-turn-helix domain-containing protein [Gemmatimonadales bacterium]
MDQEAADMMLRVLLVTDDAERVAPLAAALRATGCDVVVAAPGADEPDDRIDLVLTDPAMPPGTLEDAERRHISATLRHTQGNKRQAAHLLGIARSTLLAKVRKYGLDAVGHDAREPAGDLAS